MKRLALVLAALAMTPSAAWAWADTGHRIIGRLGTELLPPELPAFLRNRKTVTEIGELAREPDRSKGAGQPHDADLDPGHFLDGDDEGKVLGGPSISAMPRDRADYETTLRTAGTDAYKAGYLYYNLVEGWQQLVKDFAYWRAARVGEKGGKTSAERKWFAEDRKRREALIIRDLGYWSHFVGDGSQPLHMTMHYNGWGDYPNPKGYTQDKIHAPFEGSFVKANVAEAEVKAQVPAPETCRPPVQACVTRYLLATWGQVEPLYALWGQGGFRGTDPRGKAFVTARLAAGAGALRDLVAAAWTASATATVGYPAVNVMTIEESGKAPFENIYGMD